MLETQHRGGYMNGMYGLLDGLQWDTYVYTRFGRIDRSTTSKMGLHERTVYIRHLNMVEQDKHCEPLIERLLRWSLLLPGQQIDQLAELMSWAKLANQGLTALIVHSESLGEITRCPSVARDPRSRVLVYDVGAEISFSHGTNVGIPQSPGSVDGSNVHVYELEARARDGG